MCREIDKAAKQGLPVDEIAPEDCTVCEGLFSELEEMADLVREQLAPYEYDNYLPGLWRYRDYVIDAVQADLPYDRFVLEQLAGDELVGRSLVVRADFVYMAPGAPPAPALYGMATVWPVSFLKNGSCSRAEMSDSPPGAKARE